MSVNSLRCLLTMYESKGSSVPCGAFAWEWSETMDIEVEPVETVEEAVRAADTCAISTEIVAR